MAWEQDIAKAIQQSNAPSPYKKDFYIGVYANGDMMLLGGKLRYGPSQQIWTHRAKYFDGLQETEHHTSTGVYYTYKLQPNMRAWSNGMQAAVLLDESGNRILILDVIGAAESESEMNYEGPSV